MTIVSSTEVDAFASEAEDWLRLNVPARWRDHRKDLSEREVFEIERDWDRQLWAGGYAGLALPEEFGGRGLGLKEEITFHFLAARHHAPDGLSRVGKILTAPTLIAHGNDQQRAKYLPSILAGEEIWCQGFSEPNAGSDLAGISCNAVKVDGGYVINGYKTWTSHGQYADRCLLVARTDKDAPRHKNLSVFLADFKQPGVSVTGIRQISGSTHLNETYWDGAFVADEDLVGEAGQGWRIAMTILMNERGGVEAATRYVEARADVDLLIEIAGGDTAFSREITQLETKVELLRWMLSSAFNQQDDREAYGRIVGILKVYWSELLQDITSLGLKVSDAANRSLWQTRYLDARAASIYSGTNEIQRNIISERILGLPR